MFSRIVSLLDVTSVPLQAIVNVIGMTKMTPPIKDLLPRLTPILKNRSVNQHGN